MGHPWIHDMRVVPSTYDQCLKFLYCGQEITIPADSSNPQYCNTLRASQDTFIPYNIEAQIPTPTFSQGQESSNPPHTPSTSSDHMTQLNDLSKQLEKKSKIKDKGVGEYFIEQSLCLPQLSTLKSYGQPSTSMQPPPKLVTLFDGRFIKACTHTEESGDRAILDWLYKEEEELPNVPIPAKKYGKGLLILEKMGYEVHGPIGK